MSKKINGAGGDTQRKVFVTKDMAVKWLEKNGQNRGIRRSKVEEYKRALVGGYFGCSPQGIAFDTDGILIDGQHRLTAIAETGIGAWMWVGENFPSESRLLIDIGGRNFPDSLKIVGHSEMPRQEAAMIAIIRYVVDGYKGKAVSTEGMQHRYRYRKGLDFACSQRINRRLWNAAVAAAFAYAYPSSPEKVAEFVEQYRAGSFPNPKDPLLRLRDFVSKSAAMNTHDKRAEVFSKALAAIYLKMRNEKRSRIYAKDDADSYFARHYKAN